MRLLERKENEFSLTEEFIDDVPVYVILSHTWGNDDQEVTFKDMSEGKGKSKAGYQKIQFCGEQATRNGVRYFWVDTCCIDKANYTELSEAINSMFRWYREAARCYVYLSDVSMYDSKGDRISQSKWESAFRESRWFTRGWTLQELIAPVSVEFFSREGIRLGDRKSLEKQLYEATRIPVDAFQGSPLSCFSVDDRISWAQNRETKRKEDKVYSLMGIFDINMPFIYGEGSEKAFRRLYDEIKNTSQRPTQLVTSNSSATAQQKLAEQGNSIKLSPNWLDPVVRMPSQNFQAFLQEANTFGRQNIANHILWQCRAACFDFYVVNKLWRTKYSGYDTTGPKLFQLDTGGFPKSAGDLSLRSWFAKIQRVVSQVNEEDTVVTGDFYDFLEIGDSFGRMTRICSLVDGHGKLDVENFAENFEEYLLMSLTFCRQIQCLDIFDNLKAVWRTYILYLGRLQNIVYRISRG